MKAVGDPALQAPLYQQKHDLVVQLVENLRPRFLDLFDAVVVIDRTWFRDKLNKQLNMARWTDQPKYNEVMPSSADYAEWIDVIRQALPNVRNSVSVAKMIWQLDPSRWSYPILLVAWCASIMALGTSINDPNKQRNALQQKDNPIADIIAGLQRRVPFCQMSADDRDYMPMKIHTMSQKG